MIFDEKNPTSAGFQSSNLGARSNLMKISDQLVGFAVCYRYLNVFCREKFCGSNAFEIK